MEVYDRLVRTHANLKARGYVTAAEDMNAALELLDQFARDRDHALEQAREADALRSRINRLGYDLSQMRVERDRALAEAEAARMPLDEAKAVARREVRDILRPFLTDGVQGVRMLAQTIKQGLDSAWGKEV